MGDLSHALPRDATLEPLGTHARAKCLHRAPPQRGERILLFAWNHGRDGANKIYSDISGSTFLAINLGRPSGPGLQCCGKSIPQPAREDADGALPISNSLQRDDLPSIYLRSVRLSLLPSRSPNGRNMYTSTIHRCDGLLQSVLGGLCIFRRVIRHQNLSIFPLVYVTELTPRCDDCHI